MDFVKGQIAYAKYIGYRRNDKIGSIKEVIVKTIGSKYITVTINEYTEMKFDIENNMLEKTDYSPNYKLFSTIQEIEDDNEHDRLGHDIRLIFSCYGSVNLSLEKLRAIEKIIKG